MLHYYDKGKLIILMGLLTFNLNVAAGEAGLFCKKDKNKKKLHKAENYFDHKDYMNAMKLFEELLQDDPSSPYLNYHVGVCKFEIRSQRNEALKYLELANEKVDTEIYYYLGMLYHHNKQFDKAIENFKKYLTIPDRYYDTDHVNQFISNVANAQKLEETPISVIISNVGSSVNSKYSDYVPLITADGKKLFFTSRREGSTGNEKDVYGNYYEDIYMSVMKNGIWGDPLQLSPTINTNTHDACVGLTPEGENLIIFRTNENLVTGDLWMTENNGENWSEPKLLDPIINSADWTEPSACYTPDGEMIYFSSDRPGGFGGKDLYRSVKLPNGEWSLALNLGPNINTTFDEDAPFVHSNGKELYFSSKGHTNIGGYDIFKSYLDSSCNWSEAVNIGYPLNSVDDEIYFVLTADGQMGYFSSDRIGGYGETDIYMVQFTNYDPGYSVNEGYVRSSDGQPLSAKITVIETDLMKIHGVYKSNRLTGKFIFLKCEDHDYEIICEAEGYYSKTIYIAGDETEPVEIELLTLKE